MFNVTTHPGNKLAPINYVRSNSNKQSFRSWFLLSLIKQWNAACYWESVRDMSDTHADGVKQLFYVTSKSSKQIQIVNQKS